jgi:DNA-binding MarR family transcriptional regulator
MPRPRKRNDVPLTVPPRLLVEGSDAQFRDFILDLIAYFHRLDACRNGFAAIAGVSPAQYEILMLVSRTEGVSVGEVAARLHRSGAFITIETNKLVERGVLEKSSDPDDGRKVLLRAGRNSRAILERLAPYQVRINDALFGNLNAKRFRELRLLIREQLGSGERAVRLLDYIMQEAA